MLNQLRRIPFPPNLQTSGPIVKGRLLGHVHTHDQLIEQAKQRADEIIKEAQAQAEQLKQQVRNEVIDDLQHSLTQIKDLSHQNEQRLKSGISGICVRICSTVIEDFIQETPAQQKIARLVSALLERTLNTRSLTFVTHPTQTSLLDDVLARFVAEQFNLKNWSVSGDDQIPLDSIHIRSAHNSEIQVSLPNLLLLYQKEIERLAPALLRSNELSEVLHESHS